MTTTLKIEDTLTTLDQLPKQPLRVGIQGRPGEGKTWSALTFPGPIVLNLDNKLAAYQQVNPTSKIRVVNFNRQLVWEVLKVSNRNAKMQADDPAHEPNIRDGLKKWVQTFGPNLTVEDTLLVDSYSSVESWYENQALKDWERVYDRDGAINTYAEFRMRLQYNTWLTDYFKILKCNVVYTFHETIDRDKDGIPTGKMRPLVAGQFADKVAGQCSDWYRQLAIPRIDKGGKEVTLKECLIDGQIKKDYKLQKDVEYFWQTQTDNIFTACCSIPGLPKYVQADYKNLKPIVTK